MHRRWTSIPEAAVVDKIRKNPRLQERDVFWTIEIVCHGAIDDRIYDFFLTLADCVVFIMRSMNIVFSGSTTRKENQMYKLSLL